MKNLLGETCGGHGSIVRNQKTGLWYLTPFHPRRTVEVVLSSHIIHLLYIHFLTHD